MTQGLGRLAAPQQASSHRVTPRAAFAWREGASRLILPSLVNRPDDPPFASWLPPRAGTAELRAALLGAALALAALACGAEDGAASAENGLGGSGMGGLPTGSAGNAGAATASELAAFAQPACAAPAGLAAPSSVAMVVDWINALPKPLSLACFLETLERPLRIYASQSLFSAQPAAGRRSPRMFLFEEPLIMSITPAGIGSHLLEFGEWRSDTSSLKAEIVFPVTSELPPSAPFDHLVVDERLTTCGGCHGQEEPDPSITVASAFVSRALRPVPTERVSLDEVHREARACDALVEPERCAMLVAVFGQGQLLDAEFPAALDTFY